MFPKKLTRKVEAKLAEFRSYQSVQEMLRIIMLRLGTTQYPATVPQNLTDKETTTQTVESLTDLLAWTVRQIDALMGQLPLEIEVKDIDPSQQGDQSRTVTLPNLAEYASEMYGLALRGAVNSDIHTNFLMRLAAELVATKNAAIVTQDYARANASYLGYKANTVKRKIQYAFDVTKLDNLQSILNTSEKNIVGWQDEDDNTVQAYLERLMFAAGIIKQAYFKPNSQIEDLSKQLENLLGVNSPQKQEDDQAAEEAWKVFLQELNSATGGFNRNSPTVPRVTDPTVSGEAGEDITPTGFDLISDVSDPDQATG